ncbi:hypothetical protein [Bartonella phoceensis]|uniref:hypothetical protein n=1 Tax=Bartonella phoceensis TaxID=270249 RepID=UPI001ABBB00D|nr:hypothetical protein [Bartonella phoceensis]
MSYFNQTGNGIYEVLNEQQHITSIGRFVGNKFAIMDNNKTPQYFNLLPPEQQASINKTNLLVYVCNGEEIEIKNWFKTIMQAYHSMNKNY